MVKGLVCWVLGLGFVAKVTGSWVKARVWVGKAGVRV